MWDEYDDRGIYIRQVFKDTVIKIFDNENILKGKINNELKNTEILFGNINRFSSYRRYLLIEKINKRIEKFIEREEVVLQRDLREAIINHDLNSITGYITELRLYFEDEFNVEDSENIFTDVVNTLQAQGYSLSKAIEQVNHFRRIIKTYGDKKEIEILNCLKGLMLEKKNKVMSFLEDTISLVEQEQEIESNIVQENRDRTKKAFLRAGRLRSNTEMKEILEQREEYLYIKVNDRQLFESLKKLLDIAIKDENQSMLLNIDFILKYYKKFLM